MTNRSRERRVAILGAGCAGLSLACELVQRPRLRVTLFDARISHARDRTWCGWTLPDARYEDCVTARWTRWRVRGGGRVVDIGCPSMPYRHIPADRYYGRALSLLSESGRADIRLGARVDRVESEAHEVRVAWSDGDDVFDHVFDGRPSPWTSARPGLVQHFVGHEIETDRAVFDAGIATLMDFDVSQDQGIHFLYVLPFSPCRALVEATFFTPSIETDYEYARRIGVYLHERHGVDAFRTTHEESGRIPMNAAIPDGSPHSRHWRIGAAAGVVKPSTGYAFDAIHRDSARVCKAFLAGRSRPRIPRGRFANWLDRLMLSFLRSHPERASTMFPLMFEECAPERLVRFLNDRATLRDTLEVINASPRSALAWHCVRSLGGLR